MYNDLKENWSYNEWPEVDINGNVIGKKVSKKLSESCDKNIASEALGDSEICPKCGKVLLKNEPKFCKDGECSNKVPMRESEEDDAENVEELDLNAQVKDALDLMIPEDDKEFDIHELIDAVLNYFSDEEAIEYICSKVCQKDEAEDEVEEALTEASEDEIIIIKDLEAANPEDESIDDLKDFAKSFNVDLKIALAHGDNNYPFRFTVSGKSEDVKKYLEQAFNFSDGDIQGYEGFDETLDKLFNIN